MASKQETLIYIEQDNKTEAEFMSRSFVKSAIKNRAYINALGADLFIKYLASEEINATDTHNIHSISKILEKFDISDIMLPNIHIDVRVVFDENQIFIPKSHLQYEITPDIYVVLKLAKDFSHVEFLGYFEPKILNLKLKNHDYYFISRNKLSSPDTLKQFIQDFPGNTSRGISQENILRGRELSIAMADHNISDEELKELIELLLLSDELRESVLEFDNFETLSYSVGSSFPDHKPQTTPVIEEITDSENNENQNNSNNEENSNEEEAESQENETLQIEDNENLELNDSVFQLEEPRLEPEESIIDENPQDNEILNPEISIEDEENNESIIDIQTEAAEQDALITEDFTTTDENFDTSENLLDLEPLSIDEDIKIEEEPVEQALVEDIEKSTSVSVDTTEEQPTENEPNTLEKTISEAIQNNIKKGVEAGASAIAAAAAGAAAGAAASAAAEVAKDVATAEGATKDAIKLAGISGDIVNDLINKNLESQQENLNKIDYSQISTNATEVPEHIAAYDLSTAKIEADLEAEASGQFDTPKDLSELRTVEIKHTIGEEEKFEQETIDLGNMDAVHQEEFHEHTESIVDLNNLSAIDSPTTPIENLDEKIQEEQLKKEEHLSNLDFSNMSSFTINSDGSSPMDDIDVNFNSESDENLVDLGLNNNDFVIESEPTTSTTTDESLEADLMLDDGISDEFDAFDNNEMEISEPPITEPSSIEETTVTETASVEENETNIENSSSDENLLTEDNLELSTQISDELLIDDELDTSLNIDDENITLDESNTEDLNLSTETTLEELSPTLEEENLEIEEPSLETTMEEPTSINETIADEEKPLTPISNNITETPDYEEISPDALLDEVINNIAPENNESLDTQSNLEETIQPIQEENNLPIQEEINNVSEIENIEDTIQNNDIVTEDIPFESSQDTQNENDIETDLLDATNSELDNIAFDNQPINDSELDNNQMVDNQDWMNDTNYDDLQDIDVIQPTTDEVNLDQPQENIEVGEEINPEDFITEPDANTEKVYTVTENSTVISDMNFQVGEIPIDINNNEIQQLDGPEQLENLYNPNNTVPGAALLQNPGRLGSVIKGGGKTGLGIIGVILTVIIVGIIGFSVIKMMNKPTEETPQPITDDTVPTSPDNGVSDANTLDVDQNNVVNMDNTNTTATNPTPALPAAKPVQQKTTQQATAAATPQTTQQKKTMPANTFLEVSKLTWEVPDYISYNQNFKQYFQAVGKSLKLSLTSDLLLATEYAYSDQVRVSVNYAKDGTFKDAKILLSSGSKQIDSIVLQTVNQTLKVLKAPHSVGNDESTTVILKIYF